MASQIAIHTYRCMRCSRGLKDPKSTAVGYGPICLAKVQAAALDGSLERGDGSQVTDLPFDPQTMDIVFAREKRGDRTVLRFNIAQRLVKHSPTGFEWGYGGSGPADFALNILAIFTNEKLAWLLHQGFKDQVIARFPEAGGTIPGAFVRQWIKDHTSQGDRFAPVQGTFEELMHALPASDEETDAVIEQRNFFDI